ncbi:protein translocase subunit SecD [Georgenia ruanii]|uniref:Protein translocase subunit SecD n=1 Tax=Georgenia ruanii TaxID=348442 RepID=A0A7J9UW98_9MICO|nr:protein translocase subunit SecD [Georgenia ruanii]MPV88762.1 protein translocase subunit SecD [Georgenia ruanii]
MAKRPNQPRPGRKLIFLAVVIIALIGSLVAGVQLTKGQEDAASLAPKLALDLEGGTQLILTPKTTDNSQVTQKDVEQAIEVIRQRVDASGVSEAEITSQGGQNIVVSLPGQPSEETLNLVRESAQLRFRPVLAAGAPGTIDPAAVAAAEKGEQPTAQPTTKPTADEIKAAAMKAADTDGDGKLSDTPATEPANSSDPAWITEQVNYDFYTLDCTDPANRTGGSTDDPAKPMVSCSQDGSQKFILGPAALEGTAVKTATAGIGQNSQGMSTGQWVVSLQLNGEGTKTFAEFSQRLLTLQEPRNQFAVVLDGLVVSNARMNDAILDGRAQISGNFTQATANQLANQLNFGSLPLNFEVQSEDQISATLGSEQLARGVLAGIIGVILVVLYMIWQYHGLGVVSIASLVAAGILNYGVIALLSWTIGYRLSLPGVVGLIVAVGITADSFIVYFERIRDEVREGRVLSAAVERGWDRARRTILASDAVNFLAAVVLYFLAVGGVQGFAFTLGLTTLIDLVVVMLFTHPVMQLLVRTKFFGEGHRFSGLEPKSLGATSMTYRGRGRFAPAPARAAARDKALVGAGVGTGGALPGGTGPASPEEAGEGRRLTIAERRAAERARQRAEETAASPGPDPADTGPDAAAADQDDPQSPNAGGER